MADKTMMLAPLGRHRGLCCGGSPLNEICTLFGFYCRFLAYLLACALALSTAFHAPGSQIMAPSGLVAYGACAAAAMVLLESSWLCFHNRCLMTRATLLCYYVPAVETVLRATSSTWPPIFYGHDHNSPSTGKTGAPAGAGCWAVLPSRSC